MLFLLWVVSPILLTKSLYFPNLYISTNQSEGLNQSLKAVSRLFPYSNILYFKYFYLQIVRSLINYGMNNCNNWGKL